LTLMPFFVLKNFSSFELLPPIFQITQFTKFLELSIKWIGLELFFKLQKLKEFSM